MVTGDGPARAGSGAGGGADTAPVSGADEPSVEGDVVSDETGADEDVEAEGATAGEVVDADTTEVDPLVAAIAERDEYLDALRRLQAEFENYKKRVSKQQADHMSRAAASLVDKLLPVLDALDLATDHVGDRDSDEARALVAASGLLRGVLTKEGLERIDPVGEAFDPTAHEAVGQLPAPEGAEPSATGEPVVAQVMRAGYRWHGVVVRPAMVMVVA